MLVAFLTGFLFALFVLALLAAGLLFGLFRTTTKSDQAEGEQQIPVAGSGTRIPAELKAFLGQQATEWENCGALSLLLHFLFQEKKETRQFRRWLYKKLQLELNDVTARSSAAGRIVQGIQIRDLEAGTNSPIIRRVRVESFQLAEDDPDFFEQLVLLVDVDYRGGFQMSVDAKMAFGKLAHLSVKLLRLSGRGRFILRRQPFAHWSFAFVESPQMDLKIDSQLQGHTLPRHLIPLIAGALRKAVELKHVWPNYKLRFRPFFDHPLFTPSPNMAAFAHIDLTGTGLEVTVLSSSRLNLVGHGSGNSKLYCRLFIAKRPYSESHRIGPTAHTGGPSSAVSGADKFRDAAHMLSVLLSFSRKGRQHSEPLGLSFDSKDPTGHEVRVDAVEPESNAAKCGFQPGDILIAVNNIPVRNQRQAMRMLSGTQGDLLVLVEREMDKEECGEDAERPLPVGQEKELVPPEDIPRTPNAIPDSPPFEYQANDEEPEEEQDSAHQDDPELPEAKFKTGPDEGVELMVLRHHRPAEAAPDRPSSFPAPLSPAVSGGTSTGRKRKRKALKKLMTRKRADSFRTGETIKRGRKLRRSRSESELHGLMVPEVRVERAESVEFGKEADSKLNESELLGRGGGGGDSCSTTTSTTLGTTEGEPREGKREQLQQNNTNSTKREKLHMAQKWTKSKLNEYIWNRRRPAELAMEAHDGMEAAEEAEQQQEHQQHNQLDKPKRKWNNRKKSPSPSSGPIKSTASAITPSTSKSIPDGTSIAAKCTKSVQITKDPMWGQSLHFGPLGKESLYLNVLICMANDQDDQMKEEQQASLIGWTSIYVPRIVEDCMLTLSNCHRERFHLRGSRESESPIVAEFEELSRHNGFDARLCFGDLLLGFRFFPEGLPEGLDHRRKEKPTEPSAEGNQQPSTSSGGAPSPASPGVPEHHQWIALKHKQGFNILCGVCGGKIWLKWASQCQICGLTCHTAKCLDQARERECEPGASETPTAPSVSFSFNDDDAFEELDTSELVSTSSSAIDPSAASDQRKKPATTPNDGMAPGDALGRSPSESKGALTSTTSSSGCRRRRIAEKLQSISAHTFKSVQEYSRRRGAATAPKGTTTEGGGGSETPESPRSPVGSPQEPGAQEMVNISQVLDPELLKGLEGFGTSEGASADVPLADLRFEPGNAYNPQVVEEAKAKGQHLFGWCESLEERRRLINAQIDRVQTLIEQATRERRTLTTKSGPLFERSEARLQALACIMMLYCYALTDCNDKEEAAEQKLKRANAKPIGGQEEPKSAGEQ